MGWISIEVSDACVDGTAYRRLCRQFRQAYIAAGAPTEMALFAQTVAEQGRRRLFLSPGSIDFIGDALHDFDWKPCDDPEAGAVTLVFGSDDAKARLLEGAPPFREEDRPARLGLLTPFTTEETGDSVAV